MLYKNEINKAYELKKTIIVDRLDKVEDNDSKDEVRRAMIKILNEIDKDETNKDAVNDFFTYIDNIENKIHVLSYKAEAEYSLIKYIEQAKYYLLDCIDNAECK